METPNFAVEDILVKQQFLSEEDLEAARKAAPQGKIVQYLLEHKKLTLDLLGQAMSEHYNIPYFDLNSANIPKENLFAIPTATAMDLRVVITEIGDKEVSITTDHPEDPAALTDALKQYFPEKKFTLHYSLSDDIDELFEVYRESLQALLDKIMQSDDVNFAEEMFNAIIDEALALEASDIHFEPEFDRVRLRYRIDGLLRESATLSPDYYTNILNRIKVLGGIRLDEHYRTQDGAIRLMHHDTPVDLRVSIIPILEGQKTVIRILADYIKNMAMADLGLTQTNYEMIQLATKKTYGMILTTGPTGSGKTTTLYSVLKQLHRPEVNITTIEDPVEYRIPGINQIQVKPEQEITFAKGLRAIVRQDPNIILVGEIRDLETAEIAVNAALTGHLLLSTFHTNDAATAIPRLVDMGIEPFLLASTLNLIIAQRLVRRICESCRYSYEYNTQEIEALVPIYKQFPVLKNGAGRFYRGKGCEQCSYTGVKGRIGIFEMLFVTKEIQELIMARASSVEIWNKAREQGAMTYFEDGLSKVALGSITLEELVRVAPAQLDEQNVYGKKTQKS